MNAFLWILQILLAIHTAIGAVWKYSNSERAVPSLSVIPHEVWFALSVIELLCVFLMFLPVLKKFSHRPAAFAALVIAAEMLMYCGIHLASGDPNNGPMVYWLSVAAFCGFLAFARLKLNQPKRTNIAHK